MKITITPAQSSANTKSGIPFVLADDAQGANVVVTPVPDQVRTYLSKGGYQQAYKEALDRFNAETSFEFTVDYVFKTNAEAMKDLWDRGSNTPKKGDVIIYDTDVTRRVCRGAFIHRVKAGAWTGVSFQITYAIVCGEITST